MLNFGIWNEILNTKFLPIIVKNFNTDAFLLSLLEKDNSKIDYSGDQAIYRMHIGGNTSIGSRRYEGFANSLPEARGHQRYKKIAVDIPSHYGRVNIPGRLLRLTSKDDTTVADNLIDVLTFEINGILIDLKKEINQQMHRDGSGLICKFVSNDVSNTHNIVMYNNCSITHLKLNKYVDIVALNTTTNEWSKIKDSIYIVSITPDSTDRTKATIVFSDSFATNTTDTEFYMVFEDNCWISNGTLYSSEITGLAKICNPNYKIYNITESFLLPNRVQCAAVSGGLKKPTELQIMSVLQNAAINGAQLNSNFYLVMSYGVKNALVETLINSGQKLIDTELKAGYVIQNFETGMGNIKILADPDAPIGLMRCVSLDSDKIATVDSNLFNWLVDPQNGSILQNSQLNNKDEFVATLVGDFDLVTLQPNIHFEIYDIQETWV